MDLARIIFYHSVPSTYPVRDPVLNVFEVEACFRGDDVQGGEGGDSGGWSKRRCEIIITIGG